MNFPKYYQNIGVDPGGPVVVILATGSKIRGSNPARVDGFFRCKNPEYDFLQKGSKALGPVS